METLSDYIEPGLELLSIGLNPSPVSVELGVYFAGKRNRFWKALNASGLIAEELLPSQASMQVLFSRYRMGFTDVVKRPTPGVAGLRKADYRRDAPVLQQQILSYQPCVAWFHGKVAYKEYLAAVGETLVAPVDWGRQQVTIGGSAVFVSPNPSPANAAFSLADITDSYAELKALLDSLVNNQQDKQD